MGLPRHILHNKATTVSITLPSRPATSYTVSLYNDHGTAIFEDQNATLTSVDTTLSAAPSAGDTSVSVASASGISAGDTVLVGTLEEPAVVRSISGTTLTLRRELVNDHGSGEALVSSRLTYQVSAANAATRFWDGRLVWTVDTNTVYYQDAIVTSYPFYRAASIDGLWDEDPALADVVDDAMDLERLLDDALGDVIRRVNASTRGRAWSYTGPQQFEDATYFAAMMRVYRSRAGDTNREMFERYQKELEQELSRLLGAAPRDEDQDGVIEDHEQVNYRSRELRR